MNTKVAFNTTTTVNFLTSSRHSRRLKLGTKIHESQTELKFKEKNLSKKYQTNSKKKSLKKNLSKKSLKKIFKKSLKIIFKKVLKN